MPRSNFDPAEFQRTLERISEGTDHGQDVPRPGFDSAQHREVVAQATHGRSVEAYTKALESHGFTFWPMGTIPPGCEGDGILEPPRPLMEGQWRRPPTTDLKRSLALTNNQVLAWFPGGPQELWQWVENMKLTQASMARRGLRS